MKKIIGYPEILNYEWNIIGSEGSRYSIDLLCWIIGFTIYGSEFVYELLIVEEPTLSSLTIRIHRRQKTHLCENAVKELSDKTIKELIRLISINPEIIDSLKFIPKEVKEHHKAIFDAKDLNLL